MEYEVPELRYSVEPVQVVAAPPIALVKVPLTTIICPEAMVKADPNAGEARHGEAVETVVKDLLHPGG